MIFLGVFFVIKQLTSYVVMKSTDFLARVQQYSARGCLITYFDQGRGVVSSCVVMKSTFSLASFQLHSARECVSIRADFEDGLLCALTSIRIGLNSIHV